MNKILLGDPEQVSGKITDRIRQLAPDMEMLITKDRAEIEAALGEIEIAAWNFPRDLIPKAPKLRWLQQWGAGADWLLHHPEIADLDIIVTSASGVHPIQITEHILSFLLAFARQLHSAVRAQVRREWRRPTRGNAFEDQPLFELAGKTILLIGVGAIGARTVEVSKAMGMRVLGVRRNPIIPVPGVDTMYHPDQLLGALPEADFVVLTVPLTRETRGMIGEAEFRAMRSSAYIVNIGRGRTIQEDVLIQALLEGWIAGAGLDVFETEPLPDDSPLWDMENVIVTAHYAGLTPHYEERAMAIFLDNLARYKQGKPLHNVVDKVLGY